MVPAGGDLPLLHLVLEGDGSLLQGTHCSKVPTVGTVQLPFLTLLLPQLIVNQMGSGYLSISSQVADDLASVPVSPHLPRQSKASSRLGALSLVKSQRTPAQCSRNKMPQPGVSMRSLWWTQFLFHLSEVTVHSHRVNAGLSFLAAGSHRQWILCGWGPVFTRPCIR